MIIFEFTTWDNCRFMGLSQIIVEWDDDKDEQACELSFETYRAGLISDRRAKELTKVWSVPYIIYL